MKAPMKACLLVRITHHVVSFDVMSLPFNFPNLITKIDLKLTAKYEFC